MKPERVTATVLGLKKFMNLKPPAMGKAVPAPMGRALPPSNAAVIGKVQLFTESTRPGVFWIAPRPAPMVSWIGIILFLSENEV